LLQSVRSLATGGRMGEFMSCRADDRHVYCSHASTWAYITRNQRQLMGRSRGGLTSKIHVVVDGNDLPARLALSPGEAHDARPAGKPAVSS